MDIFLHDDADFWDEGLNPDFKWAAKVISSYSLRKKWSRINFGDVILGLGRRLGYAQAGPLKLFTCAPFLFLLSPLAAPGLGPTSALFPLRQAPVR
jgi:hypothetical protein